MWYEEEIEKENRLRNNRRKNKDKLNAAINPVLQKIYTDLANQLSLPEESPVREEQTS